MLFGSKIARMQHSQAKKIPLQIWQEYFRNELKLSESILKLMEAGSSELSTVLPACLSTSNSSSKKKRIWLAIAYSHPDLEPEVLLGIMTQLEMLRVEKVELTVVLGNLELFNLLAASKQGLMITTNNFCNAALWGHLTILNRLVELAPDMVSDMIKAEKYSAFRNAAGGGHLAVLNRLVELAPDKVLAMIKAEDYSAFRKVLYYGHLAALNRLVELISESSLVARVVADNFRYAAEGGHLPDLINRLVELAPKKEVLAMIKTDDYSAFRFAAGWGQLAVIEQLMKLAPKKVSNMIKANHYYAFRLAAAEGHLTILNLLVELAPKEVPAMIKADTYFAFLHAASWGHLPVLELLTKLVPDKLIADMIAADDYYAFRQAAAKGHLAVLQFLAKLTPDKLLAMIAADNYYAFHSAVAKNHFETVQFFLEQDWLDFSPSFSYQAKRLIVDAAKKNTTLTPSCFKLNEPFFARFAIEERSMLCAVFKRNEHINSLVEEALNKIDTSSYEEMEKVVGTIKTQIKNLMPNAIHLRQHLREIDAWLNHAKEVVFFYLRDGDFEGALAYFREWLLPNYSSANNQKILVELASAGFAALSSQNDKKRCAELIIDEVFMHFNALDEDMTKLLAYAFMYLIKPNFNSALEHNLTDVLKGCEEQERAELLARPKRLIFLIQTLSKQELFCKSSIFISKAIDLLKTLKSQLLEGDGEIDTSLEAKLLILTQKLSLIQQEAMTSEKAEELSPQSSASKSRKLVSPAAFFATANPASTSTQVNLQTESIEVSNNRLNVDKAVQVMRY